MYNKPHINKDKLVPWERGKPLLWDATIPDSLAPSYWPKVISEPGAVAAMGESKKATKYAHLSISHIFTPVAVESLGAFGSRSLSFIHALGRKIRQYSGNELATSYLLQKISIAVQRGNALLVMDTLPPVSSSDFFFLIEHSMLYYILSY